MGDSSRRSGAGASHTLRFGERVGDACRVAGTERRGEAVQGITVEGLDHVAIRVADQAASAAWYERLLSVRRVHEDAWGELPVMLAGRDGSGVAILPARDGRPAGFAHLAFRVSRDAYVAARRSLEANGIRFEEQDHVVSWSLYFSDPDGIALELTTYEI